MGNCKSCGDKAAQHNTVARPGSINPNTATTAALLAGLSVVGATTATQQTATQFCRVQDAAGRWVRGTVDPATGLCVPLPPVPLPPAQGGRPTQPPTQPPAGGMGGMTPVPCTTSDGKMGLGFPGGPCWACPECVSTNLVDCNGPGNWNAGIARSDMTQADVGKVVSRFGTETMVHTITVQDVADGIAGQVLNAAGDVVPDWYYLDLGSLGVSHSLCFQEVSLARVGGGAAYPVVHMALMAERWAVEDGVSYRVWSEPVSAPPDELETTADKCACDSMCICVVDEGRARLLFKVTDAGFAAAIDTGGVIGTFKMKRTDWLTRCAACLSPTDAVPEVAGRIVIAEAGPASRTTGAMPILP